MAEDLQTKRAPTGGDGPAKAGPHIEKAGLRIEKAGLHIEKAGLSNEKAAPDVEETGPRDAPHLARILVVEDEPKVANALREGLEGERYQVAVEYTGEGAFFRLNTEAFDIILLDLMLPGRDGLQILRTLRQRGDKTPVLVLTARDALEDRVTGLDSGADDYLVKPFAFEEVLARIRALLRRGRTSEPLRQRVADLELDLVTRKVVRGGRPVELTVREFELLEYLLRHQSQTVSRSMLARDVWQEAGRSTSLDNVIDVHIARLRRKVDLDRAPKLIHTVRGVGFMVREGEP
jgi:DNA-binding response OmpR family regulator